MRSSTSAEKISGGVVHELPEDLELALRDHADSLVKWESLTPLARNEWICWVTSVKKVETRAKHIQKLCDELVDGVRRPCCWYGCTHRIDKPISPSVKGILSKSNSRNNLLNVAKI